MGKPIKTDSQKKLNSRAGYTVVEVVLVLAITGVLFISAIAVFGRTQGQTDFNQAMQDLDSKIQSVANEVKSGNFDDSSAYTCTVSAESRPVLTESTSTSNQACITLGKAMQVTSGNSNIYFYTVLGLRNIYSGTSDTGVPAQIIADAHPEPIMGDSSNANIADLTEEYELAGSAQIVSAKLSGQTDAFEMAGFYLAPSSSGSSGQGSSFATQAYLFTSPTDNYKDSASSYDQIKDCLRQLSTDCTDPTSLGKWELCVHSSDGQRQAVLTISSSSGGITTSISDKDCS